MILAAALTVAQLGDLLTATLPRERNPLVHVLLGEPLLALAAKVALVAFVCAVVAVYPGKRYLMVVGIAAGCIGTISNIG